MSGLSPGLTKVPMFNSGSANTSTEVAAISFSCPAPRPAGMESTVLHRCSQWPSPSGGSLPGNVRWIHDNVWTPFSHRLATIGQGMIHIDFCHLGKSFTQDALSGAQIRDANGQFLSLQEELQAKVQYMQAVYDGQPLQPPCFSFSFHLEAHSSSNELDHLYIIKPVEGNGEGACI